MSADRPPVADYDRSAYAEDADPRVAYLNDVIDALGGESAIAALSTPATERTITVWTLVENHDGETSSRVYVDYDKLRADVWSDVEEAAANDYVDLDDGLGTDEFGNDLDRDDVGDWCRFIETHGWKCRAYEIEAQQLTIPANDPEKCPTSGRTAKWCMDQTHTTCGPTREEVALERSIEQSLPDN